MRVHKKGGDKNMKETFTLGFAPEIVGQKGLLKLLEENGVTELIEITMNGTVYKPIGESYKTEYSNVTNYLLTMFKAKVKDVKISEYLADCEKHGFPIDRQPSKLTWLDTNGHVFTVNRKGKNKYRVTQIDGKSTLNSFTRDEIDQVRNGSIFERVHSGRCRIKAKRIQEKQFDCDFEVYQ